MTAPQPGECPSCGSAEPMEAGYVPGMNGPVNCRSDWHPDDACGPGDQRPAAVTLAVALGALDMATAEPDVPALTGFDVFRRVQPAPGNGRTDAQQAVYEASSVQRLLAARATAAAMRTPLQGALPPSAAEALARSARSVGTAVLAAVWKRYAECRVPYRPDPTADAVDMAERRERIHGPLRAWYATRTPAETCGEWLDRQPDWVRHEEIAELAAA